MIAPRPTTATAHHHGSTLVEVLAVVALLALAAGVAATGLGGVAARSALERAESDAAAIDQAARRLAARTGPLFLETLVAGRVLDLRTGGGIRLAERPMPRGIGCAIDADGRPRVRFDRTGCAPDYRVRLVDRTGVRRAWRVSGSTGWATPEDVR